MIDEVGWMSGMGRKAPPMAQLEFGLEVAAGPERPGAIGQSADELFLPADRSDLYFGNERLDRYLERSGDRWVLRLRELLRELDYSQFYPRYSLKGRKALHPRTVLGLIVYGILVRRGSLREIERLARTDLGAMWLSAGHQPDHSTIGKFINLHRELLAEDFFVNLVNHLARRLRLPVGVTAADGTVIEAATSYRQLRHEAAELERQEPPAVADQPAPEPERPAPDGVLQPLKNGILRPAYKPSVLASATLIVGQRVECTSERAALWPMLAQHERALGAAPRALLLDAGYMGIELLARLAERDINVLCPSGRTNRADWLRRPSGSYFDKREFVYEPQLDLYRCPAGRELHFDYRARDRRGHRYVRYRGARCADCQLRAQCTKSPLGRTLRRYAGEEIKEAMEEVLRQPRARREYQRRKALVEPVFARLRGLQRLDRFRRRGLAAVRTEFALHCIAYNLRVATGLTLSRVLLIVLPVSPGQPPQRLAVLWLTSLYLDTR